MIIVVWATRFTTSVSLKLVNFFGDISEYR